MTTHSICTVVGAGAAHCRLIRAHSGGGTEGLSPLEFVQYNHWQTCDTSERTVVGDE